MAYFERTDERDQLVLCNICNVKCSERAFNNHKAKCAIRHADKFKNGELERCEYDFNHIVEGGMMEVHKEYCNKYQNEIVALFQQEESKVGQNSPQASTSYQASSSSLIPTADDWDRQPTIEPFVKNMSKLNL